jgi:hypothetical protein
MTVLPPSPHHSIHHPIATPPHPPHITHRGSETSVHTHITTILLLLEKRVSQRTYTCILARVKLINKLAFQYAIYTIASPAESGPRPSNILGKAHICVLKNKNTSPKKEKRKTQARKQ